MASALAQNKTFLGTSLKGSRSEGLVSRPRVVTTHALFGKLKKADKKEVQRYKNSEVVKAKRLLPFDVKLKESAPKRGFNMDAARNSPREGGFGQGKPYQKTKIGAKMEGTPITSSINPIFFAIGLSGFTIATVGFLINQ